MIGKTPDDMKFGTGEKTRVFLPNNGGVVVPAKLPDERLAQLAGPEFVARLQSTYTPKEVALGENEVKQAKAKPSPKAAQVDVAKEVTGRVEPEVKAKAEPETGARATFENNAKELASMLNIEYGANGPEEVKPSQEPKELVDSKEEIEVEAKAEAGLDADDRAFVKSVNSLNTAREIFEANSKRLAEILNRGVSKAPEPKPEPEIDVRNGVASLNSYANAKKTLAKENINTVINNHMHGKIKHNLIRVKNPDGPRSHLRSNTNAKGAFDVKTRVQLDMSKAFNSGRHDYQAIMLVASAIFEQSGDNASRSVSYDGNILEIESVSKNMQLPLSIATNNDMKMSLANREDRNVIGSFMVAMKMADRHLAMTARDLRNGGDFSERQLAEVVTHDTLEKLRADFDNELSKRKENSLTLTK
ncbi:hypothetical protein I3271_07485 [Photobacterium leiognathi]|uniref:hypothetical protein n=1 Tax=Photobacterium leiognathi TaxID=553611 RepID=UPI001EE07CC6|nr:hypothetical protein [Photobacterium leiognathi]MCG3884528.1 hypothetical protein [Photobacterium leiognathi]